MSDIGNIHTLADFKGRGAKPNGEDREDGRPVIRIEPDNLEQVVDKSEAALIASGRGLYQRGGRIVSVGMAKIITTSGDEVATQQIFERGDHALLEDLCAAATYEKYDGRSQGMRTVEPSAKIAKVLKERVGRLNLPVLTGVINAPTLRSDGSILDTPGYDAATGLLFDPGTTFFERVAERPTRGDAERALTKLAALVGTFPFVGDADRSVALAAMMTAVVRRSLPTAPLFGFSAPVAGSGKSMFVDVVSIIATGRPAGVLAQGKTDEETEKRLASVLLAGDAVIAVDNCELPLGGDILCQMLTQATVRIRLLGRSETIELPTSALVTATGNNLVLAGDMTRRALLCTFDPQVERPEFRTFDNNPIAKAKADRGAYVAAVLTILRAYVAAGRPRQADPLGSFGQWSDLVRSSLLWLGCADPVATMEASRARDPRLDELHAVVSQWAAVIGTERTTVRTVIAKATEKTASSNFDFSQPASFVKPDFREALLAVAGQGGAINSRRLGTWIGKHKNRIISVIHDDTDDETQFPQAHRGAAKWRLQSGPTRDGFATWYLEKVDPPTDFASSPF